eukprot:TRINITY_DN109920_c0_g1_i1.p1 TRINITY_DN109920_c0_g1~~TRINITY_DN109920_c0_g1_i1.p1  ORF type:complete len:178 (+),score=40.02 TRINITY_DN109920_c0_g1_i1:173-706(+)
MAPPLSSAPAFGGFAPPSISGDVILAGLPEARKLNGMRGVTVKTISDGRVVVKLEDGRELAFAAENLQKPGADCKTKMNSAFSSCRFEVALSPAGPRCPRAVKQLIKIHEAAVEFHELCATSGEGNMRWMLDGAKDGNAEMMELLGVDSQQEAEMLFEYIEGDIHLNSLCDDAELVS